MDFTPQEYPHLYNRMNELAKKAQQKREDRQIEHQFGKPERTIDDLITTDEDEMIWRLEQVNKK